MAIIETAKSLVFDKINSDIQRLIRDRNITASIRKVFEDLFSYIETSGRRDSLVNEIMCAFDSYDEYKDMDLVWKNINVILNNYGIEEEYTVIIMDLYSKYSPKYANDIKQFLDDKSLDDRFSQVFSTLNQMKSIESQILEREKNKAKIDSTIEDVELDIWFNTDGRLDLDFFDLDDFIFEDKFEKAISEYKVIEVYSECPKEAFYYVLFLLQSKKDRVRIVNSRDDYRKYVPDNENIILVAFFPDILEEERFPRCKVVRIHDRTVRPDGKSNNNIVLSPRRKGNVKSALLRVFGNDIKKVEQILDKTNGYYSLIEAELDNAKKNYAWEKVKLRDKDFENLEKFLFVESFNDNGKEYLSSIGFDVDEILLSANIIDENDAKTIPFHSEREYGFLGKKHFEYKVNSPDKVWKYVCDKDKKLPDKYLKYAQLVLENRSEIDPTIFKNLLYSAIRHQSDIGIKRLDEIVDMAFASLSNLSSSKKEILPAITELSPSRMLDWFRNNPQEINEDSFSALFLLSHTEETAEEMIELLIKKANEGELETGNPFNCESIPNLFIDIIQPYQKTTPLGVDKIIEKIESFEPVDLFKNVVRRVLPSKAGASWGSINVRYKYRSFDFDYESELPRNDKKKIISALFNWVIKNSDENDLIYIINNRAALFFVSSEVFLSSMEHITKGFSGEEKYQLYFSICEFKKEAIKEKYPENIKETINKAEEFVLPDSKMLRILPDVTSICKRYRKKRSWEEAEKEKVVELFDLITKNCVSKEEYLSSFKLMEESLSNESALTKVFWKIFGYDDIDVELIRSFPSGIKRKFLVELIDDNPVLFSKLLPNLSQDEIFSVVNSVVYAKGKTLLPYLSNEKQMEYWKGKNLHGVYSNDKQEIIEIVKNGLHFENYSLALDVLFFNIDFFSGEELFYLLKDNKKQDISPVNYMYEVDGIFSKIREASDRGEIPEKGVIKLEKQMLKPNDLCAEGSFFIRCFKRQPDIFASVFNNIYKVTEK